jgi:hypothetical protein
MAFCGFCASSARANPGVGCASSAYGRTNPGYGCSNFANGRTNPGYGCSNFANGRPIHTAKVTCDVCCYISGIRHWSCGGQ